MTSQFKNASVGILGLGKSGMASAQVLSTLGAKVSAYDNNARCIDNASEDLPKTVKLVGAKEEQELAEKAAEAGHDFYVISPGIPPSAQLFSQIRDSGAPLWSEVELAWRIQQEGPRPDCAWLCVTGTNGKTTTVNLLAQMLITGGVVATAVGNVGTPIVEVVADGACDALAVELSSFQLHTTETMEPYASIILNLSADHLDWHGGFGAYAHDKAKIYDRVRKACLYPLAEEIPTKLLFNKKLDPAKCVPIGATTPKAGGIGIIEDLFVDRAFCENPEKQAYELASFADLEHLSSGGKLTYALVSDVMAAAALARAWNLDPQWVRRGIREFNLDAHRRCVVRENKGIVWIDDSKATNAHAAAASLSAVEVGKAIWIAGGDTKGQDYEKLVSLAADRLKAVVVVGKDRSPFLNALSKGAPGVRVYEITSNENVMKLAVQQASNLASTGDTVLLAPAAASWDQFSSYAQRGDLFSQAVMELP